MIVLLARTDVRFHLAEERPACREADLAADHTAGPEVGLEADLKAQPPVTIIAAT